MWVIYYEIYETNVCVFNDFYMLNLNIGSKLITQKNTLGALHNYTNFNVIPRLLYSCWRKMILNDVSIKRIFQCCLLFLRRPIRVTDEFRFCCLARNTRTCFPPPDEFSSCEDLMSNLVLRLCVWLLAGVATVGNVLVIVWRVRYSRCNQVPATASTGTTAPASSRQLVIDCQ